MTLPDTEQAPGQPAALSRRGFLFGTAIAAFGVVGVAQPARAHHANASLSTTAEALATSTGVIQHGSDIPRTSLAAAAVIGLLATGRTEWTSSTTFSGTRVVENRTFTNKVVTIAAGANITFRNCRFVGPRGQSTYTIRATAGRGLRLVLEHCEVVARTTTSETPRCLTAWGDGSVQAVRTIFRGGIDNVYLNLLNSPGKIFTGDPLVPYARSHFKECWFGDNQRVNASHSDMVQIDGGGFAVFERCRLMAFNVPRGSDPLSTRANPDNGELCSNGIILSQNSTNPKKISHVAVRNCYAEGAGFTLNMNPKDGLTVDKVAVTGSKFGLRHRFGPLNLPASRVTSGNTWAATGWTKDRATPIYVTADSAVR
jgi:hypothetical protein